MRNTLDYLSVVNVTVVIRKKKTKKQKLIKSLFRHDSQL